MSPKTIVLADDDTIVEFKINGIKFECFPLDEIQFINEQATPQDGTEIKGEPFGQICQQRLHKHGVKASVLKSLEWYNALHEASREQEDFFDGSPASSGHTDSLPQAGVTTGAGENSTTTSSVSSNLPKTRSKPKSRQKPSGTSTKTTKPVGAT